MTQDNFTPIETAVALSLYFFNVDPLTKALRIENHFEGRCAEREELVRIMVEDSAQIALSLAFPSAVVYVEQALARYGKEARERCKVEREGFAMIEAIEEKSDADPITGTTYGDLGR